jgi:hypothetical protein
MTRRRCHIAALFSALALIVALACGVVGPDAVAWAAGLLALAAVALGEAA